MSAADKLEYTAVSDEIETLFNCKINTLLRVSYIRCQGFVAPYFFREFVENILNFEVRDDDVWVCSFPKTGTTWTQEMVWCILNNLDFEGAKAPISLRFPFFEVTTTAATKTFIEMMPEVDYPPHIKDSIKYVHNMPSPRFIKSHLPFHLLPLQLQQGQTGAKIVYVARNVKDTCLSYYYHNKLFMEYSGTLDEFCALFYNESLPFSPFWDNILGYWRKREDSNMLFLKFEELKENMPLSIQKTAKFLGKDLSDKQVAILCDHLSFEKMKDNPAVNQEDLINFMRNYGCSIKGRFIRSGQVGEGRKALSPYWVQRFDQCTQQNLRDSDLSF